MAVWPFLAAGISSLPCHAVALDLLMCTPKNHSSTDVIVAMQDGNMGLVKLVLAGRTKRAIQKLTQTFLTLSLADIAQQVGLETATEAEGHILRYVLISSFVTCKCPIAS